MRILPAVPADFDPIVALFKQHGFALTERRWYDWKYFENPVGDALTYKIEQDGELAGAVAIIPQLFRYGDREIIGLQTVDGLMSQQVRGKGMFNEVMAFLRRQHHEWLEGREFFYLSFPSLSASVKAHAHAGWTLMGHYGMQTVVLRPEVLRRKKGAAVAAIAAPVLAGVRAMGRLASAGRYRFAFVQEPGAIPEVKQELDSVHGDRCPAFMQWRARGNPRDDMPVIEVSDRDGSLAGLITVKRLERQWEVTDICLGPGHRRVVPDLIAWVAAGDLADSIDFWVFGPQVWNTGAWPSLKRKSAGALFVDVFHAPSLPTDPREWSITYLDSDW